MQTTNARAGASKRPAARRRADAEARLEQDIPPLPADKFSAQLRQAPEEILVTGGPDHHIFRYMGNTYDHERFNRPQYYRAVYGPDGRKPR